MNVYILLDRSGSMVSLWNEALGSINGYVENLPVNTNLMLATFDSISYDVLRNTTAKEWKNLTGDDAQPRGGTPLLDATARMAYRILDDNAERSIFVVMTDGEENQSSNFTKTSVTSLINQLKAKKYEVVFLGANFDKIGDVASSYGLNSDKWMNITPQNLGATMRSFAGTSAVYGATGQSVSWSDEDKKKAAL